ncbi:hypothetical protein Y032_0990g3313 [Ancylostoma ceylanicum]|uniref:Uncharacterized protein n=1 Tax=Ancylostoma ceylanicum TaxID=53326 RepID=A0A016W806_9BILA|nr:hypothetical protein Y032_0990g3313 [Ancylostoma ceylanicum]
MHIKESRTDSICHPLILWASSVLRLKQSINQERESAEQSKEYYIYKVRQKSLDEHIQSSKHEEEKKLEKSMVVVY